MNHTEELIQRSRQGDKSASEQLIIENNGLIWSIARRFIGRGTEPEDLYQLGCLGFIKAVEGFDPEYGTQFSTYAVPKIAGEIRRFLRDDGAIKVSRTLKEQSVTIRAARNKLSNALGREPSIHELSEHTGISPEDIAMAETASLSVESIHRENGDEGFTLEHILSDPESEERWMEQIELHYALQSLDERESTVIKLRYFHGLTQERIAKLLQVSQVQVSRIEKKAIAHLRERIQ